MPLNAPAQGPQGEESFVNTVALFGSCSPCYAGLICPCSLQGYLKLDGKSEGTGIGPPVTRVALGPQ